QNAALVVEAGLRWCKVGKDDGRRHHVLDTAEMLEERPRRQHIIEDGIGDSLSVVLVILLHGDANVVDQQRCQCLGGGDVPRATIFYQDQTAIWMLEELQRQLRQQLAGEEEVLVESRLHLPVMLRLPDSTLYSLYVLYVLPA